MKLEELDEATLKRVLETETRGVVVDFWSPWCAPCRALRPHLDRIAAIEDEQWRFVAVNTEAHPQTGDAFEVKSLPTLVWFQDGKEISRLAGGVTLSDIAKTLAEFKDLETARRSR